ISPGLAYGRSVDPSVPRNVCAALGIRLQAPLATRTEASSSAVAVVQQDIRPVIVVDRPMLVGPRVARCTGGKGAVKKIHGRAVTDWQKCNDVASVVQSRRV